METTAAPLAYFDLPYATRRALQAYDEAAYDSLRELAIGYAGQLAEMRAQGRTWPLERFRDPTTHAWDPTTAATEAQLHALALALAGRRRALPAALRAVLDARAQVRFDEESAPHEGFFELLTLNGQGYTEDERRYCTEDALNWYNRTVLDPADSFVDPDDDQVYPRLRVLYTFVEDGELVSYSVAERHARQKSPRQVTKLGRELAALVAEHAAADARWAPWRNER